MLDREVTLQAILDASREVIITFDAQGSIGEWNRCAVETFGWTTDEASGRFLADLIVPTRFRERFAEGLRSYGASGAGFVFNRPWRVPLVDRAGTELSVEVIIRPIQLSTGLMFAAFLRELPSRILDMAGISPDRQPTPSVKFASTDVAADPASQLRHEFLANISHELRTPMNAIIGMVDLSLGVEGLSPVVRDYLLTAEDSARILMALVDDLLDFSRMEDGSLKLDLEPFHPATVVHDVIRIASGLAAQRQIGLTCDISADVPQSVVGDARRFRQVLLNIVGNGIKFTEHGDVAVRVDVQSRQSDSVVLLITIRDTGIGIAPQDLEKIFTPFTQVDASTTRRYSGTGLGLSIARQLINRMGGQVTVESHPGLGTTFRLTPRFQLSPEPLADSSTGQSDMESPRQDSSVEIPQISSQPVQRLRILVADDTLANQRLAKAILEGRGHHVEIALNGREAVDRHEHSPYDVILMDVQMPILDGLQATSVIRALDPQIAGVLIIAMTAHALRGDRERCLTAGMNGYLAKPLDGLELISLVERTFQERHRSGQPVNDRTDSAEEKGIEPTPAVLSPRSAPSIDSAGTPADLTLMSKPLSSDGGPSSPNRPVLNRERALARMGGDMALLQDLANFYVEDSEVLLSSLTQALQTEDLSQAARNAHSLSGLAANFSADSCASTAKSVEIACRQKNIDSARQLLITLRIEVDRLVSALRSDILR